MKIIYRCPCMVEDAEIEAPDRLEEEDVVAWMERVVIPHIAVDHLRRSRMCTSPKLDYVKLPFPENAPGIGMKPRLDG